METELACQAADGHRWRSLAFHCPRPAAGLLWLPALGVPAAKYRAFGQAMAEAGLHLVVHEWRGLGSSDRRPSRAVDWGYRELVDADIPASLGAAGQLDPGLPWLVGGHSIGGQLAALHLAHSQGPARGLVLIATGIPAARIFPFPHGLGISAFARLLPAVTSVVGHFPGDRLKWAGREAGRLMREWAGTVRSGHYNDVGLGDDMESKLSQVGVPRLGLRMADDWLVPEASLDGLLRKLGPGDERREVFDASRLGTVADHFRWMRQPRPVAATVAEWAASVLGPD